MEKINDVDEFIDQAGFYRLDGTIVGPDDDFEFDQVLFEPDEAQKFMSRNPKVQVWTLVDTDGSTYLDSGVHYVNRLGYVFTTIRANDSRLADYGEDGDVQFPWWEEMEEVA